MRAHHDHINRSLKPPSPNFRNDNLVQQNPTISFLQRRLEIRQDLHALLVRPVVQDHLEVIYPRSDNGLRCEEVMLVCFDAFGFQLAVRGSRFDGAGEVLQHQAARYISMVLPEADEIVSTAAADVDHEDFVWGQFVDRSKGVFHDVRHLVPFKPERFEAHVVVEGFGLEFAAGPADPFEVVVGGVHAVLPRRVVFVGWVFVVMFAEVGGEFVPDAVHIEHVDDYALAFGRSVR